MVQPGPEGTDLWITSIYEDLGQDNADLQVGGWGDQYHTLIRFNLAKLPKKAKSAKVFLYSAPYPDARFSPVPMHLDRVTTPWGEHTRWPTRPAFATIGSLPAPGVDAWYSVDITAQYHRWQAGREPNHGLQLRPLAVEARMNRFHSSDFAADPALRPKLVVETSR